VKYDLLKGVATSKIVEVETYPTSLDKIIKVFDFND
jgi:hypothetical protein